MNLHFHFRRYREISVVIDEIRCLLKRNLRLSCNIPEEDITKKFVISEKVYSSYDRG